MSKCSNCGASIAADSRFCPDCGQQIGDESPPVGVPDEREPAMMTMGGMQTLDDINTRDGERTKFEILKSGTLFADRYMIEDVVGQGGMGVVYRATDKLSDKTVALKLIRPERLGGSGAVKRLIAEGITARDIRHPNIVAVYDVGEAKGQPFVSMEYLAGTSLRAWHKQQVQDRQDVSLVVACRIIAETLKGLSAAHAAGVVHRDLKPENIVLTTPPTEDAAPLKILDFGIARATGGGYDGGTGTGTGIGTPLYMAPEQITNANSAGPSADFYSISVMFYELLVDVLPQGHWQPPSGGRSDVPTAIDALIEKGLSNRPANRPQSAKEYLDALEVAFASTGGRTNLGTSVGEGTNLPVTQILKWSGIGVGAFVALGVVGMMLPSEDNPCDGLTGQDRSLCLGETWNTPPIVRNDDPEIPIGPPPPPPPPPPPSYQDLSGQWNDGLGTIYRMRVDGNGRFSGTGRSMDGFDLRMSGSFGGVNGTYTIQAPAMGLSFEGRMVWDKNCHIDFQTFDAFGQSIMAQGRMHVNHVPDAPCPS